MGSRRLLLAPALLAATLLAGTALLSGCTTNPGAGDGAATSAAATIAPPPSKADVHGIDWRSASYSVACRGLGGPSDQQVSVTLADGTGASAPVDWFGPPTRIDVTLRNVSYGDVTGDGQDDAVVQLSCTPVESNGQVDEIQVFGPGAELLATPTVPNVNGSDFTPAVKTLAVENGRITGTAFQWKADDPHCCPSQTLPFTFTWNASRSAFDAQ
jgi:hypothetical protein